MATLRAATSNPNRGDFITNSRGEPVVRVSRSGLSVKFLVDGRFTPGLGVYLLRTLPELVGRFQQQGGQLADRE